MAVTDDEVAGSEGRNRVIFFSRIEMSLEASCDHTPRKSGKNMFSKHLRQVNTQLFRLNGKGAKVAAPGGKAFGPAAEDGNRVGSSDLLSQVTSLHFDRLVLKLVPRELTKFMQLLTYFTTDPYYDSVDAILGFTRENYISRRNIHRDDDVTTKRSEGNRVATFGGVDELPSPDPSPDLLAKLEESERSSSSD